MNAQIASLKSSYYKMLSMLLTDFHNQQRMLSTDSFSIHMTILEEQRNEAMGDIVLEKYVDLIDDGTNDEAPVRKKQKVDFQVSGPVFERDYQHFKHWKD